MIALPLVEELLPVPDATVAFQALSRLPHCLFLDSALREPELGRYSFLAADPFEYFELPIDHLTPLDELENRLQPWETATLPGLPPFQGGAAGLLSYDLGRSLERLPAPRFDEFTAPALAIGLYDVVLAIDHVERRAWLISHGFPERETTARQRRAAERLTQFRELLTGSDRLVGDTLTRSVSEGGRVRVIAGASSQLPSLTLRVGESLLAPQFPVPGPAGLTSNFSADDYRRAVQRAVEYIFAGDVFQVNLAQRLLFPARDDAVSLYLRLRERNPATFAGYFDTGEFQIVSASPERLVSVREGGVEARPIKGTRRRFAHVAADFYVGDELRASEKDRAENVMIVDLLRNDLSRVCRPDSVRVTQLCGLEVYQFVQHLVSVVRGELTAGRTAIDVLRAAFPGGSITGAPKVRAMEIIAELEPTARGAYCGSLGYVGFDGTADWSILIRTIIAGRGWWQLPVGGGIVAQSDPQQEYEETWHKAAGLLRALEH